MSGAKKSSKRTSKFYLHPLMGVSAGNLFRLFGLYGWPSRGNRVAAFMFLVSALVRFPYALADLVYVALKRKSVEPLEAPVFIIGHWRSGTTHLYNVMGKARRFAWVSPFATALPQAFLVMTMLFRPLLVKSLPKGRYIDGIPVEADSPQEDEIALSNLTANSFFHALYFPRNFRQTFNRGLFFDGVSQGEIEDWGNKLKNFYLKLQIQNPGKRLLIKNPVYTARVDEILKLYPGAKFIHITRNPYNIFFSMQNFYQKLLAEFPLQDGTPENLDDHILATYVRMIEALERDIPKIPGGHFVEIRFEDMQKNPLKELEKIYKKLDLGPFARDKKTYAEYLKGVKGYKKNVYNFPEKDLKRVEKRLGKYIRKEKYKRP